MKQNAETRRVAEAEERQKRLDAWKAKYVSPGDSLVPATAPKTPVNTVEGIMEVLSCTQQFKHFVRGIDFAHLEINAAARHLCEAMVGRFTGLSGTLFFYTE